MEWIEGNSSETLPDLIDKINSSKEIVNLVLIDADHEYEGVYIDLQNILKYKPKQDMAILIHDSFYMPSRLAITNFDWNSNPYVHYINTDFVSGDLMFLQNKNMYMGGFALILLSPEERVGDLIINQSMDYMFTTVSKLIGSVQSVKNN